MQSGKEKGGIWRTINGRHIFIKEGQSLEDAMKEFGMTDNKSTNLKTRDITHRDSAISTMFKESETSKAYGESLKRFDSSMKSLGQYTEVEKRFHLFDKKNNIANSYTDVEKFILNAQSSNENKRLLLGKVNSELESKIMKGSGVNVKDYNIALNSDGIRHIFKKHGNDSGGQIAITNDNIVDVIDTVIKPDYVKRTEEGGLLFTKTMNGKINAITLISNKNKRLTLKTAYIHNKK